MPSIYGFGTRTNEQLLSRFFGVELPAVDLILWLARNLAGATARPVITGGLIADGVGALVSIMGAPNGAVRTAGWSSAGVYVLLGKGIAYFGLSAPAEERFRHPPVAPRGAPAVPRRRQLSEAKDHSFCAGARGLFTSTFGVALRGAGRS
jgi:hypothetical protein